MARRNMDKGRGTWTVEQLLTENTGDSNDDATRNKGKGRAIYTQEGSGLTRHR